MNDSSLAFVDTNILVYAVADDGDSRCHVAAGLLRVLNSAGRLRTSTQVLQEAFVTLTKKIERKLTLADAEEYIETIAAAPVTPIDLPLVRKAIELTKRASISYWDALIIAAADRSGAKILYTEDLQHNQELLGVRIVNPFISRATSSESPGRNL